MRVLLVSDIHANLAALDAVIQAAGEFDQVWCLGDSIGYGPEPNACIERLRAFDLVCLAGNHDAAVIGKVSLEDFSQDARDALWWTRERLAAQNVRWLETLPAATTIAEYGITLVHGSPRDPIWEYMVTPEIAGCCLDMIETPVCFFGHTHIPTLFRKPTYGLGIAREELGANMPISLTLDRLAINPGSVGQPRDDDPRAAFAILDLGTMTLTYHRVRYDVGATQRLMRQAQLPSRLIWRLRHGE